MNVSIDTDQMNGTNYVAIVYAWLARDRVVADVAARLHREQTHLEDISAGSIVAAMRATIKEKTAKMSVKLGKLAAIANPVIGDDFLKEV